MAVLEHKYGSLAGYGMRAVQFYYCDVKIKKKLLQLLCIIMTDIQPISAQLYCNYSKVVHGWVEFLALCILPAQQ